MTISLLTHFAAACDKSFFGFPTWYKYLPGADTCDPRIGSIAEVWLIGAAVLEILLRVASLAALVYLVWGGIDFVMSQGEPEKTARARKTVINAIIGLVLAIGAASIVSYAAGRFS